MVTILPRSAWTDTPAGAFGNVRPDRTIRPADVCGLVAHWPGDNGRNYATLSKAQVAEKIRGYHAFHTGTRGWADIGYPFAIDMAGRIWTGAGTKYAAAHSATSAYSHANQELMAALLVIGENETPSRAMVDAFNDLRQHLQTQFPNLTQVMGHRDVRGAATTCPGPAVRACLTNTGMNYPTKEATVSRPTFVSPAQGRISSEWGSRRHPITGAAGFHRGLDIANSVGTPIYAAYGGTVTLAQTSTGNNAVTGAWNTGRAVIIAGSGGGNELYGHLDRVLVKKGQKVRAGDQIGTMGATGNVTGPHLHFECWNGRSQGGGANGPGNTRNPRTDFSKHGITPGSKPVFTSRPSSGSSGSGSSGGGGSSAGSGRRSGTVPNTGGIKVTADGVFGPYTIRAVQQRLRNMRYRNHTVDGQFGPYTIRSLQSFLRKRGLRHHAIDGDFGPHTIRSLQRYLRNQGHRRSPVDGDFGRNTILSLQECLLDGDFVANP